MSYPDKIMIFSGDHWGVTVEDFMRTGLEEDDFWNINEFFTLASDGELVQALVLIAIYYF